MVVEDDQVRPVSMIDCLSSSSLPVPRQVAGSGFSRSWTISPTIRLRRSRSALDLVERPFFTALILGVEDATRKARCSRTFSFSRWFRQWAGDRNV